MGSVVKNKEAVRKAALQSIAKLERRFATNVEALIEEVDEHIKSLTPVYTGQAVRNYIWTTESPFTGVYDAIDNGPTGATNSMPLGMEPRRAVNESAAAESLAALSFANPFQAYYLTNNSPDIVGLELGVLPGPPLSSRSPNGMFKLVQTYVSAKIGSKGILT